MVWASQEPADDSTSGFDSVRAKPLKRRCGSRAGLSRYYSSKSQSFSSLELVQCTQFGTSAKALSKRPSSFDLRRGNPRAGKGLSHACSSGVRSTLQVEGASMSLADEDVDDRDGIDTPTRCPCNDTIFADPSEAFMSPEGSPSASASPLQLYGMCSGSVSTTVMTPYQQQRHYQLTAEYLTHLSALLPLQRPFASASASVGSGSGELFSATPSSSNCCSSFNSGSSSSSSSTNVSSFCDSAILTMARLQRQPVAVAESGVAAAAAATAASHAPSDEAATHALLQAGCEEADWRNAGGVGIGAICGRSANSCSGTGGAGGAAAAHILGYQSTSACVGGGGGSSSSTFASGVSRPCRNSLRPGGYLVPAYGACTASPTAAEPSCAPAGGGGGSGSSNVAGGGGSAMLGRKLGLGLPHRRFRAAQAAGLVAVHSARHAAAGLWLSTEDMIAALTLSDRQMPQQQQVSAPRAPAWPSGAQPGGGGSGFGPGHNASTGGTCRPQQQLTAVPPPPPPPATTTSVRGNDGGGSPSRIARPSCVEAGSRQRLQHEQQWLCGSAPAASLSFGV